MSKRSAQRGEAERRAGGAGPSRRRAPQDKRSAQRGEAERRAGGAGPYLLVLTLLLPSCLPTIADRVAEVQAKLVGVKARDLNGCVGVPFSIDEDGETEYLTYRWFEEEESDPFDAPAYTPPVPGGRANPLGRDPIGSDPAARDPKSDRPPRGVAYCELVFEVREGRVRSVEVEARRANGLNDNAACISKAERCAPRR